MKQGLSHSPASFADLGSFILFLLGGRPAPQRPFARFWSLPLLPSIILLGHPFRIPACSPACWSVFTMIFPARCGIGPLTNLSRAPLRIAITPYTAVRASRGPFQSYLPHKGKPSYFYVALCPLASATTRSPPSFISRPRHFLRLFLWPAMGFPFLPSNPPSHIFVLLSEPFPILPSFPQTFSGLAAIFFPCPRPKIIVWLWPSFCTLVDSPGFSLVFPAPPFWRKSFSPFPGYFRVHFLHEFMSPRKLATPRGPPSPNFRVS